jgi:hypothetical protein
LYQNGPLRQAFVSNLTRTSVVDTKRSRMV